MNVLETLKFIVLGRTSLDGFTSREAHPYKTTTLNLVKSRVLQERI